MKEYHGKSKALTGLGIAIILMLAGILALFLISGINGITIAVAAFLALIMNFLYKGMVVKISVNQDQIVIQKPLTQKVIRFSNIAFCIVHGIDETDSIIYAFVKKRAGTVKGIKQKIPFEEIVKIINRSENSVDLDINFNMADKIPVSLVTEADELKNVILDTLGGHQKRIINNL